VRPAREHRLGQKARDVGQRGARLAKGGEGCDPEHVVGARPPVGLEEAVEDPHQVIDRQVGICGVEDVHGRGRRVVVGVEDDHPPDRVLGQAIEDVVDQVALGVDHDRAPSCLCVLEDEVGKEGRLPRPGRPEHVGVLAGVGHCEPDGLAPAGLGVAQHLAVAAHLGRRGHGVRPGPGQPGDRAVGRQVGQGSELAHRVEVPPTEVPGAQGPPRAGEAAAGEAVAPVELSIPAFPYTQSGVFVHLADGGVGASAAAGVGAPSSPPPGGRRGGSLHCDR
jgi:hypothetical protein